MKARRNLVPAFTAMCLALMLLVGFWLAGGDSSVQDDGGAKATENSGLGPVDPQTTRQQDQLESPLETQTVDQSRDPLQVPDTVDHSSEPKSDRVAIALSVVLPSGAEFARKCRLDVWTPIPESKEELPEWPGRQLLHSRTLEVSPEAPRLVEISIPKEGAVLRFGGSEVVDAFVSLRRRETGFVSLQRMECELWQRKAMGMPESSFRSDISNVCGLMQLPPIFLGQPAHVQLFPFGTLDVEFMDGNGVPLDPSATCAVSLTWMLFAAPLLFIPATFDIPEEKTLGVRHSHRVPFGARVTAISPMAEWTQISPDRIEQVITSERTTFTFTASHIRQVQVRVMSSDGSPLPHAQLLQRPGSQAGSRVGGGIGPEQNLWPIMLLSGRERLLVSAPGHEPESIPFTSLPRAPDAVHEVRLQPAPLAFRIQVDFGDYPPGPDEAVWANVTDREPRSNYVEEDDRLTLRHRILVPTNGRLDVHRSLESRGASARLESDYYRFARLASDASGPVIVLHFAAQRLFRLRVDTARDGENLWPDSPGLLVYAMEVAESVGLSYTGIERGHFSQIEPGGAVDFPTLPGRWRVIVRERGDHGGRYYSTVVELGIEATTVIAEPQSMVEMADYEIIDSAGRSSEPGTVALAGRGALGSMVEAAEFITRLHHEGRLDRVSDGSLAFRGTPVHLVVSRSRLRLPVGQYDSLVMLPINRSGLYLGRVNHELHQVVVTRPETAASIEFLPDVPDDATPAQSWDGWSVGIREVNDGFTETAIVGRSFFVPLSNNRGRVDSLPPGDYVARLMKRTVSSRVNADGRPESHEVSFDWKDPVTFNVSSGETATIRLPVTRTPAVGGR